MEFNNRLLIVLKKKTMDDPKAVTNQVKRVAKRANKTGLKLSNHSTFIEAFLNSQKGNQNNIAGYSIMIP